MGGDITVRSTPGMGSSFTVRLPLEPVEPPAAPASAEAPADAVGAALNVLVAEDHPVNQAYMEAVLENLGHRGMFAPNGEEAVRALQQRDDFDVVLMDLHMPVMDGFAATRAIRALDGAKGRIPIIALTADAFAEAQQRAREAGVDGFLTKPAHLPQLRDALARYAGGPPAAAVAPVAVNDDGDRHLDAATVMQLRSALSTQQYAGLLEGLFGTRDGTLRALREAALHGNAEMLREQAHALKGAALSLGLRSVAGAAARLHQSAASSGDRRFDEAIDELDRALQLSRAICRQRQLLG
jgi:CheY-like chemotaxis protein/HPt (histidine-containing phosphotransfer) domain-containing protein